MNRVERERLGALPKPKLPKRIFKGVLKPGQYWSYMGAEREIIRIPNNRDFIRQAECGERVLILNIDHRQSSFWLSMREYTTLSSPDWVLLSDERVQELIAEGRIIPCAD